MNCSALLFRRLQWLQVPGALLIALLQKTPALRVVANASDFVVRSPAASLLKSAATALGALGAVHTLAGATTLSASSPSPASATVGTAKTVVFSVLGTQSPAASWTIGGTVPPGLSFNGGATSGIVNITSGLLTLSGTPTTAGNYTISLKAWENSGGKGNVSPTFSYIVNVTGGAAATPPAFTSQPSPQTVTAGASASFTVAASGSPAPTFQWQKNSSPLAGQTGTTLTLNNVQAADAGSYTCVATNTAGTATSSAATLTVNAAAVIPSFTTQPSPQTVTAGTSASFTVAASGSPAPTYQWRKDASPLAGQTGTTLNLSNVQAADAGSYTCVATNTAGSATSSAATLTVNAAAVIPSFTTQPSSQTVTAGTSASFTVAASGTPTPTYQWRKGASAIAGQTGTTLTLNSVQAADAGSYTCVATNTAGSTTSAAATLTVNAAPVVPAFTTQPSAQSVAPGGTATFTVAASGSPTPTFQWRKDSNPLAGQTGTTLALNSVQAADAGSYTCVATNTAGSATSSAAALTVTALAVAPAFTTQPSAQSVAPGGTATFTVAASGSPTPTFQWRKDSNPIAGQTGTTLTLNSVLAADAGSYTCVATNTAGSATSSAAALTVTALAVVPAFTTQPSAQSAIVGATVTLTIAASGSPTPTFQWQKDGSAVAGQTGVTLTLNSIQVADAGSYTCVATNSAGAATSTAAAVTVSALPVFNTQPVSQTAAVGATLTLTITASGFPTPTLQWRKDGNAVAGQTGTSLTLNSVQLTDAGTYTCVAANAAGSTISAGAVLTVSAMPVFTLQPGAQSALVGTSATFTIATSGSPTPTYQWRKNGSPIAGQTSTTLVLSNVQAADAGSYTCVATNPAGSTVSAAAALTVSAVTVAPAFTAQPASQSVNAGSAVVFTVAATGTPTPTYQWRKNGAALAGQTDVSLALSNVQSADAGSYTCVASNSAGVATSAGASLTVTVSATAVAPSFTSQPATQVVGPGGNATFAVAATGSPAPSYQWLKDGVPITGQTGSSLALSGISASAAGKYSCSASNSAGTTMSSTAILSVVDSSVSSMISNVSVRTTLEASQTLIVGFTMQGGSKPVLVRAVGPGLANFGVAGAMPDPSLALYRGSDLLMQNDNWGGGSGLSTAFASVGAFPLTPASLDAAVMRNVEGGHTVQISGNDGGNVLVEAYDAGSGSAAHLSNVSARNRVGSGADIMIAGFTIGGTGTKNLLIRAVGPTLADFGVPGTLVAPKLEVYDSTGTKIAENDGWSASLASAFSSVGAFPLTVGSRDAALIINVPPGGYTVQVAGADGGTGEALVELYELP